MQTSVSKECGCQPAGADCAERRGRGRSELISELFVRKEDLRMACSCDERVPGADAISCEGACEGASDQTLF